MKTIRRWNLPALLVVLALTATVALVAADRKAAAGEPAFDLDITNGRVIDPETGRDEVATVAVKGGTIIRIVAGGEALAGEARQVIDAAGRVVAPGFINTHTHEYFAAATRDNITPVTRQLVFDGVTLWLGGNCGMGPTGIRIETGDGNVMKTGNPDQPMREFLDSMAAVPLYNNWATLSGNMTLRSRMGLKHMEHETAEQIVKMKAILADDLEAGAFGVSFGVMYDMGVTPEAMIELARTSREHGGMAASHTRYPTFNQKHLTGIDSVLFKSAITEAIETCRTARVPFIVSHITDMTQAGSFDWTIRTLDEAVRSGLPLAGDIIGHDFLANDFYILTFKAKIPVPVMLKLGNYTMDQFYLGRDISVDGQPFAKKYSQVTLEQAEYLRKNVERIDGFADQDDLRGLPLICRIIPARDTVAALQYPWVFIGNDAGGAEYDPATGAFTADMPRGLATFSRLFGHWSREEGALTLHQALFKATIAPALWLGLTKKGRLQEGCDADLVIFDPATIKDRAGWLHDTAGLKPDGISHVIVNGTVVVENNQLTGATPGRLVRRTWTVPGDTGALLRLYEKTFGPYGR